MATQSGSCHCGRIAFDVDVGDGIAEVYDCNCSMCRRRGGLLWFAPRTALDLKTPEADLDTYRFNQERLAHRFCRVCGVAPFSEGVHPKTGVATVAVNVRCLPGVELAGLKVVQVDGASL